jgi:hypothetical protein
VRAVLCHLPSSSPATRGGDPPPPASGSASIFALSIDDDDDDVGSGILLRRTISVSGYKAADDPKRTRATNDPTTDLQRVESVNLPRRPDGECIRCDEEQPVCQAGVARPQGLRDRCGDTVTFCLSSLSLSHTSRTLC